MFPDQRISGAATSYGVDAGGGVERHRVSGRLDGRAQPSSRLRDIFGRRVSAAGSPIGSDFLISGPGALATTRTRRWRGTAPSTWSSGRTTAPPLGAATSTGGGCRRTESRQGPTSASAAPRLPRPTGTRRWRGTAPSTWSSGPTSGALPGEPTYTGGGCRRPGPRKGATGASAAQAPRRTTGPRRWPGTAPSTWSSGPTVATLRVGDPTSTGGWSRRPGRGRGATCASAARTPSCGTRTRRWRGATAPEYLVVWQDNRNYLDREQDIYGRVVLADGSRPKADFRISGTKATHDDESPGGGVERHAEYLVVWEDYRSFEAGAPTSTGGWCWPTGRGRLPTSASAAPRPSEATGTRRWRGTARRRAPGRLAGLPRLRQPGRRHLRKAGGWIGSSHGRSRPGHSDQIRVWSPGRGCGDVTGGAGGRPARRSEALSPARGGRCRGGSPAGPPECREARRCCRS